MSQINEAVIVRMLRSKNGSVRVRGLVEFMQLLGVKNCRLDTVKDEVRRCRNLGMIKLKTRDGVTRVKLRPAWK